MSDDAAVPAVRIGPEQFLLAAERVAVGLDFAVAGETFTIVGDPAAIGGGRYLANIRATSGSKTGTEFMAQLQVGHQIPSPN